MRHVTWDTDATRCKLKFSLHLLYIRIRNMEVTSCVRDFNVGSRHTKFY
jgi:hypothetical protein